MPRASWVRCAGCAALSAALLITAFPPFTQPWCAWIALVPWLLALKRMTARQAFWWSSLAGLVFFLGSLWWLIHVTLVGWLLLCAYLALFWGLFGLAAAWVLRRSGAPASLVVIPSLWVAAEYLRSYLLSGFGWNALAYSQTSWLPVIQIADLVGVWGVSWVVVVVNAALAGALSGASARRRWSGVGVAAGVVAATLAYGAWCLSAAPNAAQAGLQAGAAGDRITIAIVQGNVPQDEKWEDEFKPAIVERYARLTQAAMERHPALIVWPETSIPGIFGVEEPLTTDMLRYAQSLPVPLLTGAPMGRVDQARMAWELTNSALLFSPDGSMMRHDKLHLVPFGEFVPGEPYAPWLRKVLPPIGEFVPGREYTVFSLPVPSFVVRDSGFANDESRITNHESRKAIRFSVLICFEDMFPELARTFAARGARILFTITNDAWFGPTAAAYQHAQGSTFRAVELRLPVVRAANTGWSGCISPLGRWEASVHDGAGRELFVEGVATCSVTPGPALPTPLSGTFRRWGDWWAYLCLLLTLGYFARLRYNTRSHAPTAV